MFCYCAPGCHRGYGCAGALFDNKPTLNLVIYLSLPRHALRSCTPGGPPLPRSPDRYCYAAFRCMLIVDYPAFSPLSRAGRLGPNYA